MENFEIEKKQYIEELKNTVLLVEKISLLDYANELGEENLELIKNPSTIAELNLAKRGLEMFNKLKSLSKTIEYDPENNSAYLVGFLTIKGIRNHQYLDYAVELLSEILYDDFLKGKFIVDKMSLPKDAMDSIFKYELSQGDIREEEFAAGMISGPLYITMNLLVNNFEKENELDFIFNQETGIPKYLKENECVLTYLNQRENNPKDDYVMSFRISKGI